MRTNTHRKFLFVLMGLAWLAAFSWPSPGKAQGIVYGDRIQEGEVVDQNMILNGVDVVIDGTVNGDVMAFGRTITLNGKVDGSLLAFGETVVINGQVSNNAVAGGILMEFGSSAEIGRDLYFAGARLTLVDGASVQRDLSVLALEAQLAGEIGRDIKAIIGPLQIGQIIMGPIQDRITVIGSVQAEDISLKVPVQVAIGSGVLAPILRASQIQQEAAIDTKRLGEWGVSSLRNLAALIIIGLLTIWLFPVPLQWAGEEILESPWRSVLSGISVLVVGWFIFVFGIIVVVSVAIFFYTFSMPNLGFLFGMLGLLGMGLGASVFWLSIAYISKLVVAFLIGKHLLHRFAPQHAESKLWPLLLGIFLFALAASIPYLGWVIATIATFFGMGALWAIAPPLVHNQKKLKPLPAVALAE
jgi:hypothetical protein